MVMNESGCMVVTQFQMLAIKTLSWASSCHPKYQSKTLQNYNGCENIILPFHIMVTPFSRTVDAKNLIHSRYENDRLEDTWRVKD